MDEGDWQRRFDDQARMAVADYQASGWDQAAYEASTALFFESVRELQLPSRSRSLDLGCGPGAYSAALDSLGFRVVGVDLSREMLRRARTREVPALIQAAGTRLPFRSGTFDLIFALGVLQSVRKPEGVISEVAQLLRPGGILILSVLNGEYLALRMKERLKGRPEYGEFMPISPPALAEILRKAQLILRNLRGIYVVPPKIRKRLFLSHSDLGLAELGLSRVLDALFPTTVRLSPHFFLVAEKTPTTRSFPLP